MTQNEYQLKVMSKGNLYEFNKFEMITDLDYVALRKRPTLESYEKPR